MTSKEYQNIIHPLIQAKLEGLEVKNEWTAFTGYRNHYSPRVDIAVGTYSVVAAPNQIHVYNQLLAIENIKLFISKLYDVHIENIGLEVNKEITTPPFLRFDIQKSKCSMFSCNRNRK